MYSGKVPISTEELMGPYSVLDKDCGCGQTGNLAMIRPYIGTPTWNLCIAREREREIVETSVVFYSTYVKEFRCHI